MQQHPTFIIEFSNSDVVIVLTLAGNSITSKTWLAGTKVRPLGVAAVGIYVTDKGRSSALVNVWEKRTQQNLVFQIANQNMKYHE